MEIFEFMLGLIAIAAILGIGVIIGLFCAIGAYFRRLARILTKADKAIDPAIDLWVEEIKDCRKL